MGYVRTGEDLPEVCPSCRSPLRKEFNFCPQCGERIHAVCPECRTALEPGWQYCPSCGLAQGEEAPAFVQGDPAMQMRARAEERNNRGTELYENNEFEEAVREFTAAISLFPDNPLYHVNLGVALSEMGEYERAISELQEALRLDPNSATAYLNLGYAYQEMEKPMQAVEAWKKVGEIAPDSPEAEDARDALDNV